MGSSYPFWQCYAADVLSDAELGDCEWATRGIWWYILCAMHQRAAKVEADGPAVVPADGLPIGPGTLTGRLKKLALECRCDQSDFRAALVDLRDSKAADVFGDLDDRKAEITVVSRRMVRDAARKQKRREKYDKYERGQKDGRRPTDRPTDRPAVRGLDVRGLDEENLEDSPPPPKGGDGQLFDTGPAKARMRDVAEWWNALAAEHGLKSVQGWDADDDKKVRARLKQFGDPQWFDIIEREARILSDFGKTFVTIRWMHNGPRNFKKFMSGDYRDEGAAKRAAKGEAIKSGQQKALADMRRWRDSVLDADKHRYQKRLAMYRTKDSLGQVPAGNVWILEQLGEALE